MRTKLIVSLLLLFMAIELSRADSPLTNAQGVVSLTLPVWKTEQELRRWAVADPDVEEADIVIVESRGNRIAVIPKVTGSGIWRVTFYVYGYDPSTEMWRPRGVFFTATKSIKAQLDRKSDNLVIKSKAGRTLLTLPLVAYVLDSTPAAGEQ